MALIPKGRYSLLDAGARDGYISRPACKFFQHATAIDLEEPSFMAEGVTTARGDITSLTFRDDSFDTVVCAEVLEHIPPQLLRRACNELARVARYDLLIGVPYKQDLRVGRTTCPSCGAINPPWGHVNTFDELTLRKLFPTLTPVSTVLVGSVKARTNVLSALLMDWAHNPWGTYNQGQACIHCGRRLVAAPARLSLAQRVTAGLAFGLNRFQEALTAIPAPVWIHMLFRKRTFPADCRTGTPVRELEVVR